MSWPECIIDVWQFSDGNTQQLDWQQSPQVNLPIWFHCDRNKPELETWLLERQVDPVLIKSLLAQDTRSRFQLLDDGAFLLILRGVNLNAGSEPDDMLSLRFLFTDHTLYSVRRVQSKAISGIRESLHKGEGPKDIADLVVCVIEQLHRRIVDFLDPIETFVDEVDVDQLKPNQRLELRMMQKRLLKLNRFLKPQGYAIADLNRADIPMLAEHQLRIENQNEELARIRESIDFYLAQLALISDAIEQQLSERMNQNTYILSVIAGVFLPLGFLTGLFGINVGGIPGTENPLAFSLFCAVLTIIGFIVWWLLRRLKFV